MLIIDRQTGLTDLDEDIARLIRKSNKPVMLACNKVDTAAHDQLTSEFYRLGLDSDVHAVSASSGYGTGDFLDALVAMLPDEGNEEDSGLPKFAVVGRPNVGKSTLINTLVGNERNMSNIAGTTRDSVHTHFNTRVDFISSMAGLRRTSKSGPAECHDRLAIRSIGQSSRFLINARAA